MSRSPGHPTQVAPDVNADDPTATASFAARKARFLAVVSHELRTPLTSIASFTDSLAGEELAAEQRPLALDAIRRNTERMLSLVEDLMLLSRLETGDLPLACTPVEMPSLVREAADALTRAEPQASVEVTVQPGPPVHGDGALLRQVIYAAAGAVTGHAADHRARLSAAATGDRWTVTVVGRQAEALTEEHLLASTLATAERPGRRRSMALWILLAGAVAERHGGQLAIDFDPAEGAIVAVQLPTFPGKRNG